MHCTAPRPPDVPVEQTPLLRRHGQPELGEDGAAAGLHRGQVQHGCGEPGGFGVLIVMALCWYLPPPMPRSNKS